jgi:large subunit ribosomal protein L24
MPSKVKIPRPAKAPKCHVRRGDQVIVLSGASRGKTGTVIKLFPFDQRALVEGEAAQYDTRHVKANPQANVQGGRVQRLRSIHISKLALLDPTTKKAAKVRHERTDKGMVRVAKKSGHRFLESAGAGAPAAKP